MKEGIYHLLTQWLMHKMLQLFLPELFRDKAAQTPKPYAILIPLLLMVVKEAIDSGFFLFPASNPYMIFVPNSSKLGKFFLTSILSSIFQDFSARYKLLILC